MHYKHKHGLSYLNWENLSAKILIDQCSGLFRRSLNIKYCLWRSLQIRVPSLLSNYCVNYCEISSSLLQPHWPPQQTVPTFGRGSLSPALKFLMLSSVHFRSVESLQTILPFTILCTQANGMSLVFHEVYKIIMLDPKSKLLCVSVYHQQPWMNINL